MRGPASDKDQAITIEHIVAAYTQGYFPMANGPRGPIGFYYYEPRGILPLDHRFTVRRSLRQALNRPDHHVRFNTKFRDVLVHCARHEELPREEIWLSDRMIQLYEQLHTLSIAHSVEVFDLDDQLVGGLYGIALGSAFFGESMFSTRPYASQIALVHLVQRLVERGFTLLDAQMSSEHLQQFGLIECSQSEYLVWLDEALKHEKTFD